MSQDIKELTKDIEVVNSIISQYRTVLKSFYEVLVEIRVQGLGYEMNVKIDELKRQIDQILMEGK